MSNSIGHGYPVTDEPNLSKLNKQAKSLVAIAADCGWRVRQSPLGMIALEVGLVGAEHGYQQLMVPITSTRGPWAISGLRKVLLYGTRNTAKYQAGLAEMGPVRGLQLSELIKWTQTHDIEPEVLPVETTSRNWDVDPQPAMVTPEGQGLLDELLPAAEPEHAHVPDEPEPEDIGPLGPMRETDPHLPPPAVIADLAADMLDLASKAFGQLNDRIGELEAELESERAKRQELEDNLNALGDLIGQIRRT